MSLQENSSETTSYGQMRQRSTWIRIKGREEYGEGRKPLLIGSTYIMVKVCMAASVISSVVFIDVTTEKYQDEF